ncbi:GNAT family N-acetyltransferase [Terrihabitans sp. B22-R8]|uniref:GNAT family N-acetyltransferase n=1 Tax=Terrihabitans sp. B22-R8 TaxID=3425128 RepID=UPI00403C38D5
MTSLPLDIGPETPDLAPAIERLHERAFGPGRFARSAFRLREGVPHLPELSFVARVATMLVGSVRLTPIRIGNAPALLLGPLTVEPAFMDRGIGGTLMQRSLDAARDGGHRLVLLVGDEPYYGRFGFQRVAKGRVVLPGPVDPGRVLVCELVAGAFDGVEGAADRA